jgi:hypothetical protein
MASPSSTIGVSVRVRIAPDPRNGPHVSDGAASLPEEGPSSDHADRQNQDSVGGCVPSGGPGGTGDKAVTNTDPSATDDKARATPTSR